MKGTAVIRFTSKFEYWDYTTSQDPVTGQVIDTFHSSGDINCLVVPTPSSIDIFTKEGLHVGAHVRKLVDRRGNVILRDANGLEYFMRVFQSVPQYNAYGILEGWKSQLKRV
jgi:hypothetical protein